MTTLVGIGDFSRMTHLSVKALRHYHDVGLLEPADIDRATGYRRYELGQVATALVIRRFRELDMPIDEVRGVLDAPDDDTRNEVIVAHLRRMEGQLQQTMTTVESLRKVLERPSAAGIVEYRAIGLSIALAARRTVTASALEAWWMSAFDDLHAAIEDRGLVRRAPDACLYPNAMFELEEGEMVAYVPIDRPVDLPVDTVPVGSGIEVIEVPAVEVAVLTHVGPYETLDQTYAALGTVVTERSQGVDGPIREHYLVGPFDVEDPSTWQTEVCWPVLGRPRG